MAGGGAGVNDKGLKMFKCLFVPNTDLTDKAREIESIAYEDAIKAAQDVRDALLEDKERAMKECYIWTKDCTLVIGMGRTILGNLKIWGSIF